MELYLIPGCAVPGNTLQDTAFFCEEEANLPLSLDDLRTEESSGSKTSPHREKYIIYALKSKTPPPLQSVRETGIGMVLFAMPIGPPLSNSISGSRTRFRPASDVGRVRKWGRAARRSWGRAWIPSRRRRGPFLPQDAGRFNDGEGRRATTTTRRTQQQTAVAMGGGGCRRRARPHIMGRC